MRPLQRHEFFANVTNGLTPPALSPAEEDVVAGVYDADPNAEVRPVIEVLRERRETLPDTRGIHIAGRRWFQRTYGNTYHRVRIQLPGGEVIDSGKHYGYGEGYLQTAWDLLAARDLVQGKYGGTLALRERYEITYDVADVGRERDL